MCVCVCVCVCGFIHTLLADASRRGGLFVCLSLNLTVYTVYAAQVCVCVHGGCGWKECAMAGVCGVYQCA